MMDGPLLVCLHYLGGSAAIWEPMIAALPPGIETLAIDLPGFGDAAGVGGYAVADMAAYVGYQVRQRGARRWALVGNSMGAKVAAVVARLSENGVAGFSGLEAIVTLAGSPPGPEPMSAEQRERLLALFDPDDPAAHAEQAAEFVDQNVGSECPAASRELAVSQAMRANPAAWRAWLTSGSREDWGGAVGVLRTPALLLSGALDGALGQEGQERFMAPHFAERRIMTLPGTAHLLPLERPAEVAGLIAHHVDRQSIS